MDATTPPDQMSQVHALSPAQVARVLLVMQTTCFAVALFIRAVDPVIPKIADELHMEIATVALLSTAFTLPFALMQPVLGALADILGKLRLFVVCLAIVTVGGYAAAFASDFPFLVGSRVVTGMAAGGVMPVALAIAGDLLPMKERQVGIGRILAATTFGNLIGSSLTGLVADLIGWRGNFILIGTIGLMAFALGYFGLRGLSTETGPRQTLSSIPESYRAIFRNPLAKVCFGAVFLEGVFMFGVFPYIAPLLHEAGETRSFIAGIVIAGFGLGGIIYSVGVARVLPILGEKRLMLAGSVVIAAALLLIALRWPWQAQVLVYTLLGVGFYSLHGVIQIYASELAPHARGSAMSLHSLFLFTGMGVGPVIYGHVMNTAGLPVMMVAAACAILVVGAVCSTKLRRPDTPR